MEMYVGLLLAIGAVFGAKVCAIAFKLTEINDPFLRGIGWIFFDIKGLMELCCIIVTLYMAGVVVVSSVTRIFKRKTKDRIPKK